MPTLKDFTEGSNSQDDEQEKEKNSWILPLDLLDKAEEAEQEQLHRRQQAADALEERVCNIFQSLDTPAGPASNYDLYNGILFRVLSLSVGLQINALELDLKAHDEEALPVKVFTRIGEYNLTTSLIFLNETAWEEVTTEEASLVRTSDTNNTVIPAAQFRPVVMEPQESRLFYVTVDSGAPLFKAVGSDTEFDDKYAKSSELETHVGFGVKKSPFLDWDDLGSLSFVENRPFYGVIHYETKLPCEDQRDTFSMELPYFTDQPDPAEIVKSLTNSIITQAIVRAMSRDVELIKMQNFGGLRFQATSTETNEVPHEGESDFDF